MSVQQRMPAAAAALVLLSACAGLRPAPPATSMAPEPPTRTQEPEQAMRLPPPQTPPPTSHETSPPSTASNAIPVCTPAPETKTKPKAKSKPKPVLKKAPPQLPTAPAVAETPPGGVVDAEVKPMPVSVMSILGKRVRGPKGDDLGRVVDVLADASGRVRVAIIDFGGFLGVGDRRVAVDWPLLRFNPDGQDPSLLLSVDREQVKSAPEYKESPRPKTLMEPVAVDVPAAAAASASAAEPKK